MTLDNVRTQDYTTFVAPFLRNGVILDTCVLYELLDGLIKTRIGGQRLDSLSEFEQINAVFDVLHLTSGSNKLYVTPHILTEFCRHLETTYNSRRDYKRIVDEIFPILENMGEHSVSKENFFGQIDRQKPIIEAGDISIFVIANDFINRNEKVAVLTKDGRIRAKYETLPNILVMDYRTIAYNLV